VTLEGLDRSLDVFGRAWERKDVDVFVACFVEWWNSRSRPAS
jgi:hypothetical protein